MKTRHFSFVVATLLLAGCSVLSAISPPPSKASIEASERAKYAGDNITSMTLALETVAQVQAKVGTVPLGGLGPDAQVWVVTIEGDLNNPIQVNQHVGAVDDSPQKATSVTEILSARDGSLLMMGVKPAPTPSPSAWG